MNNINRYYEILGLKPGASQAEVKEAYHYQAKTWHPDLFPGVPQLKQKAEEKFKEINEAYQQKNVLSAHFSNRPNVRIQVLG